MSYIQSLNYKGLRYSDIDAFALMKTRAIATRAENQAAKCKLTCQTSSNALLGRMCNGGHMFDVELGLL